MNVTSVKIRFWSVGWEGDSRREGMYLYLSLIQAVVQKLAQHCKAVILKKKKEEEI